MRHIYYGVKRKTIPYIADYELRELETDMRNGWHRYSFIKEEIKRSIERLEAGLDYHYVVKQYTFVNKEVFIAEKNHEHICNIGESIKIGTHEGNVNNRKYDAESDTMYYYTNIIVKDIESEEADKTLEEARKRILKELKRILEEYYPEEHERLPRGKILYKKKSFWERFFG